MKITEHYVVYNLNQVLDSKYHLALEKVDFEGWVTNSFQTEKEAIDALVKDKKHYTDFVILKQLFIGD